MSLKTEKRRSVIRTLACLTALMFTVTSTAVGQPFRTSHASSFTPIEEVQIPENLGTIQATHRGPKKAPWVVVIQDAHMVLNVQQNIQKMINHLQQQYGFHFIGLEGGEGPLDATLIRSFPENEVKEKVFKDYFEKGELNGAEMALVLNPQKASYYGIEDWKLYEENTLALLKAGEQELAVKQALETLRKNFDQDRLKVYSPKLNAFHRKREAFHQEKLMLFEFLKYLRQHTGFIQEVRYPQLMTLMQSMTQEESHSKEALDVSLRQFANEFKKDHFLKLSREKQKVFSLEHQAYLSGLKDAGAFLQTFVDLATEIQVSLKLTPPLQVAFEQSETLAKIKGTKLYFELEPFLDEVEWSLSSTETEKELLKRYKALRLLESLASLEVTRDQFEAYQADPNFYLSILSEHALLNPALQFYRLALERDQALYQNLDKLMKAQKQKSAIVVVGGFHAKGFEENLKKDGYSYVSVLPKANSLKGSELYEGIMNGKLSYQANLESTFYDAFMSHATSQLASLIPKTRLPKTLKIWRDQVIRELSDEGRVTQARSYTRYLDRLAESEDEKSADTQMQQAWEQFEAQLAEFSKDLQNLVKTRNLNLENIQLLFNRYAPPKTNALSGQVAKFIRELSFKHPDLRPPFSAIAQSESRAQLTEVQISNLQGEVLRFYPAGLGVDASDVESWVREVLAQAGDLPWIRQVMARLEQLDAVTQEHHSVDSVWDQSFEFRRQLLEKEGREAIEGWLEGILGFINDPTGSYVVDTGKPEGEEGKSKKIKPVLSLKQARERLEERIEKEELKETKPKNRSDYQYKEEVGTKPRNSKGAQSEVEEIVNEWRRARVGNTDLVVLADWLEERSFEGKGDWRRAKSFDVLARILDRIREANVPQEHREFAGVLRDYVESLLKEKVLSNKIPEAAIELAYRVSRKIPLFSYPLEMEGPVMKNPEPGGNPFPYPGIDTLGLNGESEIVIAGGYPTHVLTGTHQSTELNLVPVTEEANAEYVSVVSRDANRVVRFDREQPRRTLTFYDLPEGEQGQEIESPKEIRSLALSPDGKRVALIYPHDEINRTVTRDFTLQIWDTDQAVLIAEERYTSILHFGRGPTMTFSPNGKWIAFSGEEEEEKHVYLIDAESAKMIRRKEYSDSYIDHADSLLVFSNDSSIIAGANGDLNFWSVEDKSPEPLKKRRIVGMHPIAFFPGGDYLLARDPYITEGINRIFSVETGEPLALNGFPTASNVSLTGIFSEDTGTYFQSYNGGSRLTISRVIYGTAEQFEERLADGGFEGRDFIIVIDPDPPAPGPESGEEPESETDDLFEDSGPEIPFDSSSYDARPGAPGFATVAIARSEAGRRDTGAPGELVQQILANPQLEALPPSPIQRLLEIIRKRNLPLLIYGGSLKGGYLKDLDVVMRLPSLTEIEKKRIEWRVLAEFFFPELSKFPQFVNKLSPEDLEKGINFEEVDGFNALTQVNGFLQDGRVPGIQALRARATTPQEQAELNHRVHQGAVESVSHLVKETLWEIDELLKMEGVEGSFKSGTARIGGALVDFLGVLDVETGLLHGKPGVEDFFFTKGLQTSLSTMALEVDEQGTLHLHDWHNGVEDLSQGQVRGLGEVSEAAFETYRENVNYQVVLKNLRLKHQFGFTLAPKTQEATQNFFQKPEAYPKSKSLNKVIEKKEGSITLPSAEVVFETALDFPIENDIYGMGLAVKRVYAFAKDKTAVTHDLRAMGAEPILQKFGVDLEAWQAQAEKTYPQGKIPESEERGRAEAFEAKKLQAMRQEISDIEKAQDGAQLPRFIQLATLIQLEEFTEFDPTGHLISRFSSHQLISLFHDLAEESFLQALQLVRLGDLSQLILVLSPEVMLPALEAYDRTGDLSVLQEAILKEHSPEFFGGNDRDLIEGNGGYFYARLIAEAHGRGIPIVFLNEGEELSTLQVQGERVLALLPEEDFLREVPGVSALRVAQYTPPRRFKHAHLTPFLEHEIQGKKWEQLTFIARQNLLQTYEDYPLTNQGIVKFQDLDLYIHHHRSEARADEIARSEAGRELTEVQILDLRGKVLRFYPAGLGVDASDVEGWVREVLAESGDLLWIGEVIARLQQLLDATQEHSSVDSVWEQSFEFRRQLLEKGNREEIEGWLRGTLGFSNDPTGSYVADTGKPEPEGDAGKAAQIKPLLPLKEAREILEARIKKEGLEGAKPSDQSDDYQYKEEVGEKPENSKAKEAQGEVEEIVKEWRKARVQNTDLLVLADWLEERSFEGEGDWIRAKSFDVLAKILDQIRDDNVPKEHREFAGVLRDYVESLLSEKVIREDGLPEAEIEFAYQVSRKIPLFSYPLEMEEPLIRNPQKGGFMKYGDFTFGLSGEAEVVIAGGYNNHVLTGDVYQSAQLNLVLIGEEEGLFTSNLIQVSRNAKRIAHLDTDKTHRTLTFYDLPEVGQAQQIESPKRIRKYALSPDGKRVAFIFANDEINDYETRDFTLQIWDIDQATLVAEERYTSISYLSIGSSLVFSPNGKRIAFTGDEEETNYVYLVDSEDAKIVRRKTQSPSDRGNRGLVFSNDSSMLAGINHHLDVWSVEDKSSEPLRTFEVSDVPIAFSPGGDYLLTKEWGYRDKNSQVYFYSIETGKPLALNGIPKVLSSGLEGIFSADEGVFFQVVEGHRLTVSRVIYGTAEQFEERLANGGFEGTVIFLDPDPPAPGPESGEEPESETDDLFGDPEPEIPFDSSSYDARPGAPALATLVRSESRFQNLSITRLMTSEEVLEIYRGRESDLSVVEEISEILRKRALAHLALDASQLTPSAKFLVQNPALISSAYAGWKGQPTDPRGVVDAAFLDQADISTDFGNRRFVIYYDREIKRHATLAQTLLRQFVTQATLLGASETQPLTPTRLHRNVQGGDYFVLSLPGTNLSSPQLLQKTLYSEAAMVKQITDLLGWSASLDLSKMVLEQSLQENGDQARHLLTGQSIAWALNTLAETEFVRLAMARSA